MGAHWLNLFFLKNPKKSDLNSRRNLADLMAPTLFGEIELFCQIRPVCSARAVTRVSAFKLDRPTFDKLFKTNNQALMKFNFNVARVACHRLAIADEMLARVLTDEDLCELRRNVWTRMGDDGSSEWRRTTGLFRRPPDLDLK